MRRYLLLFLLGASAAFAQQHKPCIAFSGNSTVPLQGVGTRAAPDLDSIEALRTAVTLSGDFDFYDTPIAHPDCWIVDVVAMPALDKAGRVLAGDEYAVSWVITDPKGFGLGHGLAVGPHDFAFESGMRKAAAELITDMRRAPTQGSVAPVSQPCPAPHP